MNKLKIEIKVPKVIEKPKNRPNPTNWSNFEELQYSFHSLKILTIYYKIDF